MCSVNELCLLSGDPLYPNMLAKNAKEKEKEQSRNIMTLKNWEIDNENEFNIDFVLETNFLFQKCILFILEIRNSSQWNFTLILSQL